MLEELKRAVFDANLAVQAAGLVKLTWGNVSGVDRASACLVIKPSGVPYAELRPEHMVVVSLRDGSVVEGQYRPSSDTPTHRALYVAWAGVGGICHTHSPSATAWAQAGRDLPCYGTTHADHFYGTVPLCRELTPSEVTQDYEGLTGQAIIDCFAHAEIDPMAIPAVLQSYHAPFTWGKSPMDAVNNSIALEMCAQMAWQMTDLHPDRRPLPQHLLDKHFLRKHGPGAYYGQK
jgi:L-ribulose-5-phosphate 4-epimerase